MTALRDDGSATRFVFDFGGVVFRWRPAQLLQRMLPARVPNAQATAFWVAEFFQHHGGDWGEYDRGTVGTAELVQRIARRTGLAIDEVQRVIDGVPGELQPQPDTVALMRRLRDDGRRLYYLSNMPAPFAAHLQASHDFMPWFEGGLFSSQVQLNKPEPAIYAQAAARFDAKPQQLVLLDDHAPNIAAARAAGWQGIVFSDAAQAEAELRDGGWW